MANYNPTVFPVQLHKTRTSKWFAISSLFLSRAVSALQVVISIEVLTSMSIKAPATAPKSLDGTNLRIAIVHARWNETIIDPLVRGAQEALVKLHVRPENIYVSSCPGSFELPYATQNLINMSQTAASTSNAISATDLLSEGIEATITQKGPLKSSFDAVISIGVLIKGETMHFEYICDAVSHGLMRVQLESRVPVIFGVLTVLTEDQAKARAGLDGKKHNHGVSWGEAAVEMALQKSVVL